MTVSTRFAVPLLVLVSIALIPVAIYSAVTPSVDDCQNPEGLLRVSEISSTSRLDPDKLARPSSTRHRDFIQRVQGSVGRREAPSFQFAILRVYGLPEAIMRPTSLLKRRFEVNLKRVEQLEVGSDRLPVHMDIEGRRFAAYFFVYGDRPVKNPFLARLSGALHELVNGRRPLTSIMIAGQLRGGEAGHLPKGAREWLGGAWNHYRRECGS